MMVYIFPHLDWIRRDTPYLSVFSPKAGKYGPELTPYLDTFHAVYELDTFIKNIQNCHCKLNCSTFDKAQHFVINITASIL